MRAVPEDEDEVAPGPGLWVLGAPAPNLRVPGGVPFLCCAEADAEDDDGAAAADDDDDENEGPADMVSACACGA